MIGNAPLVGAISVIRGIYRLGRMRVRQWGRLPLRRGATVLIANHQHEDESEIICERTFLQGPWRRPIFTVSSRRMYEPGFFATRIPLLRFAREWNATPFFLACGMLPIEHQLSSRPLASLALEVARAHGDLPLEEVFRPEALAAIPGAERCSDVLRPRHFEGAQEAVKLALLHEPFRSTILGTTRANIDADLELIRSVLAEGATFFITPEGMYSTDGRMRPLRGIAAQLTPLADVWLAAIAFDPFRGRRLSMLYRVLRPTDPDDLQTSLAAARPVTTSALLAERFGELDGSSFTREDLVEAIAVARAGLPAGAFVDPELREPARCVDDALATLVRRGTIVRDGGGYRLGAVRADPRFPLVEDAIAYQRNVLAETRAALLRRAAPPMVS
jgi:hypothetical protein